MINNNYKFPSLYSFSTTRSLSIAFENMNQCSDRLIVKLLTKPTSRLLGAALTPVASLVDSFAHATFFAGKAILSIVLLPYNSITTQFKPEWTFSKDFELSSALEHLPFVIKNLINIPCVTLASLISPKLAASLNPISLQEKYCQLQNDKSQLQLALTGLQNEVNTQKANLDIKCNKLINKVKELSNSITSLKEKKSTLESRLRNSNEETTKAITNTTELTQELQKLHGKVDTQSSELATLNSEKSKLEKKLQKLEQLNSSLKEKNSTLESRLRNSNEETTIAITNTTELTQALQELRLQMNSQKIELDRLNSEKKELEKKLQELTIIFQRLENSDSSPSQPTFQPSNNQSAAEKTNGQCPPAPTKAKCDDAIEQDTSHSRRETSFNNNGFMSYQQFLDHEGTSYGFASNETLAESKELFPGIYQNAIFSV